MAFVICGSTDVTGKGRRRGHMKCTCDRLSGSEQKQSQREDRMSLQTISLLQPLRSAESKGQTVHLRTISFRRGVERSLESRP